MNGEINTDGLLTIWPETPSEAYALRRWLKDFKEGDDTSVLRIEWDKPVDNQPGDKG